jgi:hypothetical protein
VFTSIAFAQFGDIRGKIINAETLEPVGYVPVSIEIDGTKIANVLSSTDGTFIFSDLKAGNYTLKTLTFMGFRTFSTEVFLAPGESDYSEVMLAPNDFVFKGVNKIGYKKIKKPVIVVDVEKIKSGPFTNPIEFMKTDPSLTFKNGRPQKSDARAGQLAVINNNTIQIGPLNPTSLNLGQIRLIASGVPAMYGDFIGGAIEYSTSDNLAINSSFDLMTRSSSLFNPYHQNTVETLWYKPLIVKDSATKLAFSHSMFLSYNKDGNPSQVQLYQLNEEDRLSILENPISAAEVGTEIPTASQFTSNQFNEVAQRQNAANINAFSSVRVSFKPNARTTFHVEPSLHYVKSNSFSFANSLLNAEHNPLNETMTGKINAQLIHKLKLPYDDTGAITYNKDLFSKINYILIADYQRVNSKTVDPLHGDNVFNYGHIGSFESRGQDFYNYVDDERTIIDQNGNEVKVNGYYEWAGYQDTSVSFTSSGSNRYRSAFNESVFRNNSITSLSEVNAFQGLLNGQNPSSVHSMWYAPGAIVSNYRKSDYQKASFNAIVNMAFHPTKKLELQHDLQFGLLVEQRKRSYYSLNANSLWQLMPQLLNQQYTQPNLNDIQLSYDENGMFTDTVNYQWTVDPTRQTAFDRNLRNVVDGNNGYQSRNAHFIDVNTVNPSLLSIDMFSADELWNNGSSYVGYAGYDHRGNLVRGRRGLNDFLNDEENRFINAYNPIYTALWLQDKFVLKDIKLRVGLRVERFDGNQQVLADQYSLYPVKTVDEVQSLAGVNVEHPSTMNGDYAVYVDDMNSPTKVVGYRNGSQWYNHQGIEIQSAELLRIQTTQGVIQPYLVDANNQQLNQSSFVDYSPEIMVLPRLSFSFPIKNNAMFYAYYDMFAQRPSFGQSFTPISSYYYLENASNTVLPNPNLKPARRTDYKLGFKQVLGESGVLNLTAGYAEVRDDINLMQIDQAYPRSYITYGNIDFSTVKSFKAEYTFGVKSMDFVASYLLQFADGTGSNANSAAALIQANQPNLRSLYPLDYDIRHKLNFNAGFNLHSLANGGLSCIFENSRLNVYANTQSGTPFTALVNAIPEAQNLGVVSRSQIKGNPFGSRIPWLSTVDLALSKALRVKSQPVVLQLNVTNIFNLRTVYDVYAYSSSATDDGFLSSPQGQQQIANELNAQSFVDYYSLKQNNPTNFGNPRIVSLTLRTTF